MRLLIDGYNLLHATDLFGAGELAGTLRGSREALLDFLATRLTEKDRRATLIVFDAADAPAGLPDRVKHGEIEVRFARGYPDADSMIEAILEHVHRAKHLTVVSGDRRVQRAARASGATWVDSEAWFDDLCRKSDQTSEPATDRPRKGAGSNQQWVDAFSDPQALKAIEEEAAQTPPPASRQPSPAAEPEQRSGEPAKKKRAKRRRPPLSESDKASDKFGHGVFDPFPPGYGDDLLGPGPSDEGKAE